MPRGRVPTTLSSTERDLIDRLSSSVGLETQLTVGPSCVVVGGGNRILQHIDRWHAGSWRP